MKDDGGMPAPPYRLVDNEAANLTRSLVAWAWRNFPPPPDWTPPRLAIVLGSGLGRLTDARQQCQASLCALPVAFDDGRRHFCGDQSGLHIIDSDVFRTEAQDLRVSAASCLLCH